MSARTLGIYVHVPFCRTRCRYCDFYRVGEHRGRMDRFVAALEQEIEGWTELHGRTVETLFFGGGTPSLLEPHELGAIVDRLATRFRFAPDAEITAEANPSDLDATKLAGLRAAGLTRLSIGVQSFVDRELTLLGRRHDAARIAEVVAEARHAGFDNLSLDLMIGIPAQTDGSFAASVARAIELAPEHLSLYLLEVHANSEIDGLKRKRPRLFAGEEAQRRRYLRMKQMLETAGWPQYEISNFARPGRECRHNLRYWRCDDWLGLGPAAHSFVDGRRFRHLPDLERWIETPNAIEELPCEPGVERVMLGLRLAEGVEESALGELPLAAGELERRLSKLAPFLLRESGRIRLREEAFLVSNAVLAELIG